jgi:hypothetical protein
LAENTKILSESVAAGVEKIPKEVSGWFKKRYKTKPTENMRSLSTKFVSRKLTEMSLLS